MKRFSGFLVLLAILLAGCAKTGPEQPGLSDRTLVRASIESTDASRATFDRVTYCQLWREGDRISIFDQSGNTPFELQSGAGTASGTFQSDIHLEENSVYYALFPYSEYATLKGTLIKTRYPDTLRYDPSSGCALGGNLMVAKSNGTDFTFYNAATFIELQITGSDIITGITVTGNSGETVAGDATIALSSSGISSLTIDKANGATSLFVDCGEGIALSDTPSIINIAVAPVFKNGFTLHFNTRSQRVLTRRSSNPTVLNTVLQMPLFQYEGTSYAILTTGSDFNARIKNLANGTANATSSTDNTSITCVAFETGADLSDITTGVDVSADGDGSILAVFDRGTVTVKTSCDYIKTGTSGSYIFSRLKALTTLEHPEKLLTDEATTMRNMFHYCVALKTVDVSWVHTDNVTNITSFFNHCEGLTAVDISAWNPAKVTELSYLFNACSNCKSITLGENFKQIKAPSYYCLFLSCKSLTSVDEENLNFSATTNINKLFSQCSALTELDFSTADAPSLAKADSAFYNCSKLERVNLAGFNTRSATHLRHFFNGCNSLSEVSLGSDFLLTATNRANFFPALSAIQSVAPSCWKLPLTAAQTLIKEYNNAAAALLAGKLVLQNASGNNYLYKNSSGAFVTPTELDSADSVMTLTVCEP